MCLRGRSFAAPDFSPLLIAKDAIVFPPIEPSRKNASCKHQNESGTLQRGLAVDLTKVVINQRLRVLRLRTFHSCNVVFGKPNPFKHPSASNFRENALDVRECGVFFHSRAQSAWSPRRRVAVRCRCEVAFSFRTCCSRPFVY